MADDIRALLRDRDPNIPEEDYPKLQGFWNHVTALAEHVGPDATAAEPAITYRAAPSRDD